MIRVTRLERDSQLEGQIESGMRRTDWILGMMEEPVERKGKQLEAGLRARRLPLVIQATTT